MVEYLDYSREQLVEEVQKKEASRVKLKEKLVQLKELSINTAQVLQVNRKLEEQLSTAKKAEAANARELQTLRTDLKTAHELTQEANTLLTEQEKQQQSLQKQLSAAKAQASKAEHSCSQAKAAKVKSDMAHTALEKELGVLKKQFAQFRAGLDNVERQQKADHQDVAQLKTQAAAPATGMAQIPVPAQEAMPACQGCSAVQEAVQSLQMQLQAKELASGRGSTKANSAPSTQDHSGDTHDDRAQAQVRSELRGVQEQLTICQDQQERFEAEMHRWRTLFGSFAALAAPNSTALPSTSDLMQISPAGAEGSNVVHRQMPELHVRTDMPRAKQTSLHQPLTASPPIAHIGSTADVGEGAVFRVSSAGEDSDTFSAAAGTTGSLMLPAQHRPQQHLQTAQRHIQPKPTAVCDAAPAEKASPKRKTIALQPGALQLPDGIRKRRKIASAGQTQQDRLAQQACHITQQPQHQAPESLPRQHAHQSKRAQSADATGVEFMERQLARICNSEQPITAALVTAVAQDICTAWQCKQCPLDCIVTGFIAVLLDCTAPPASLSAAAPADPLAASHNAPQCALSAPHVGAATSSTPASQSGLEDGALTRLWCSDNACQQHHVSWLLHCSLVLDGMLSSPTKAKVSSQAGTPHRGGAGKPLEGALMPVGLPVNTTAGISKKRGRPPGSRNKKTLLKLQAEGLSLQDLPLPKAKQPSASQQQPQQRQEPPMQTSSGPLPEGSLLSGLHKQALHYLSQTCQLKLSDPFEAEACCLSAGAAGFARLLGKVQAVRVQVVNILCSFDIDSNVRLCCAAAAVEVWPEALLPLASPNSLPSSPAASWQNLDPLGLCMHAYLQHLCQEHCHPGPEDSGPARVRVEAPQTDLGAPLTGRALLLRWGHSAAAQTAAQVLQQLLATFWEARPALKTVSRDQASQAAGALSVSAAEKALSELRQLGTTENGDKEKLDQRWVQLGFGLQLMVGVFSWEWAYEQVLNKLMGPIVSALLGPATKNGGDWAVHSLEQLLNCMQLTVQAFRQNQHHRSMACKAAVQALLTRLTSIADKHSHLLAIHRLLSDAVQSMRSFLGVSAVAAACQDPSSHICLPDLEVEQF